MGKKMGEGRCTKLTGRERIYWGGGDSGSLGACSFLCDLGAGMMPEDKAGW